MSAPESTQIIELPNKGLKLSTAGAVSNFTVADAASGAGRPYPERACGARPVLFRTLSIPHRYTDRSDCQ